MGLMPSELSPAVLINVGSLIAIMLGRLHMTVDEAIKAYLSLSKNVFSPKHKINKIADMFNVLKLRGLCDSAALERAIKDHAKVRLGEDQTDALLLETKPTCHM